MQLKAILTEFMQQFFADSLFEVSKVNKIYILYWPAD